MDHDPNALGSRAYELRALLVPFINRRVEPQDVDDVVQSVFVRIQRGIGELRDSDKLVAWGYQIARNVIIDHTRRRAVRKHDALDRARSVAAPFEEDDSGARELALILGHFIAMLPDPYRDALRLTELEGMTQADAAKLVGLSLSGMKSRVQRARLQLRELLEACCAIELDTRGSIIEVEPTNPPADLPNCCARASFELEVRLQNMTNTRQASSSATTNPKIEEAASCCGGPAPAGADACCVKDAAAKAAGESGCGCGSKAANPTKKGCC
ncbi:MAG: sigma-70 family RNA polymerase sigma factor [Kofleriaceae bacterium]